jgi:tetratricopeptide (TPR) repeat protein
MTDVTGPDRLVSQFLREIDRADEAETPSSGPHPDEETLALFALGELRGPERDELVRHLARCEECRRTAGAVMSWPEIAESVPSEPAVPRTIRTLKGSMAWAGLAAAAALLVAVGLLIRLDVRGRSGATTEAEAYARATDRLGRSRFDEARAVAAEAAHRGLGSDRLRTVEAQALRRMPGTLALAYAGRLTDFGYEIGGATARSTAPGRAADRAEEALKALAPSGPDDPTVVLNRGHALLTLQRPREALAEFRQVEQRRPDSALARLGEGLALFALADYPAAEEAFRSGIRLDPDQAAARINLAMTLAEEGKIDEALAAWEDVLARPQGLTDADRRAIEQEVRELRAARPAPASPPAGPAKKETR